MTIGTIIDSRGVELEIHPNDLIDGIVVVVRVLADGEEEPRLAMAMSDDLDWLSAVGLLTAAQYVRLASLGRVDEED